MSLLRTNLARVRKRIADACEAAGRAPDSVRLIAVTKSVGADVAVELCALGQLDLGENRVQELERKAVRLATGGQRPRWHLIGHLQRNKVRKALAHAAEIHSVDSLRLLDALSRTAEELATGSTAEDTLPLGVYLEVKLVASPERSGFAPAEVAAAAEHAARLPRLRLAGLMAIAAEDPRARPGDLGSQGAARRAFAAVRELAADLPRELFAGGSARLSLGMSSDLEAAIHEGADVVRVGTALFEGLPVAASADSRPEEGGE